MIKNSLIKKIIILVCILSVFTNIALAETGFSAVEEANSSIISLPSNGVKGQVNVGVSGNAKTNVAKDSWATSLDGWSSPDDSIVDNKYRLTKAGDTLGYRDITDKIDMTKNYLITIYGAAVSDTDGSNFDLWKNSASVKVKASDTLTKTQSARLGIIVQSSEIADATDFKLYLNHKGSGYSEFNQFFIQEITVEEYTEGLDALMTKYPYRTEGTKSTVCAIRLKSIGKNLFDGELESGSFNITTGAKETNATVYRSKIYTRIPNQQLKLITNSTGNVRRFYYDVNKNFISTELGAATETITPPSNAYYIMVHSDGFDLNSDIMVTTDTTATTFEKYTLSTSYIYAEDENGNVIEKHSLPNGVKDEVSGGKLYKRTKKYTLQSGDITALTTTNTNVDYVTISKPIDYISYNVQSTINNAIWDKGYTHASNFLGDSTDAVNTWTAQGSSTNFLIGVPKGTYADLASAQSDLAGASYTYQLATPIVYENGEGGFSITGSLESYDGDTTIMVDPYLKKSYTTYSGTITLDYPIESINKLLILQDGIFVDIPGTLSSDGKTITVSGAGTYQVEGVIKSEEHAGQQLIVTYPLNTAASIKSIGDLANDNAALISDHEWKLLYIADDFIALELSLSQQGTTAARPVNPNSGDMYFDTDLGKPIWHNGTNWIDATATIV